MIAYKLIYFSSAYQLASVLVLSLLSCICTSDNSYESNQIYGEIKDDGISNLQRSILSVLSVCKDGPTLYTVSENKCRNGRQIASGQYRNSIAENGWGVLEVRTNGESDAITQAYAAGFIEGVLTREVIHNHYRNTVEDMCKGEKEYCKNLYNYLSENLKWIEKTVNEKPIYDAYWKQVNLTFAQLTGIAHGYFDKSMRPTISFDITPIYMLQLSGELIDLEKYFNKKRKFGEDSAGEKCSGFVKLAPGNADLFFAHVAMSGYNTMNRVLKLYNFAYNEHEMPGYASSFSSYGGTLASLDDFVLTSAGLALMETTFAIFNSTLYSEYIRPEKQLHCWLRSIIANRLASSAKEWAKIFGRYNSGTYNNQWSILDYKLFEPGKKLPSKGLLWVLEQAPGLVVTHDMSWYLINHTYWPSYNIPYFKMMSEYSGFDEKGRSYDWYKWGSSPRAKIFERDHGKVVSIDELTKLMRYNNYKNDPYSVCKCIPPYTAEGGISTRGDLNPVNGTYELESMGHRNHGGIDYKGTNFKLSRKMNFRAWGGPTYDPLPVFSWNTTNIIAKHYGQPNVWNFNEMETAWKAFDLFN